MAAGNAPMIELEGIGRHYGSVAPVLALERSRLKVHVGAWVAVVGASGSGKTTLLNIFGCLDRQTMAPIGWMASTSPALSDRHRAGLRSRHIGFIFQSFHLLAYRTVLENVMLAEVYRRRHRAGRAERAVRRWMRWASRVGAIFCPPSSQAGSANGSRSLALSINGPRLLLCDEPTGNLDSVATAGILELLSGLHRRGLTIIMITHDASVAGWAERQVRIVDGQISGAA